MSQIRTDRITSTPDVCGGKPCIAGTRIRVQDVYVWHELQGVSADELVSRFPHLTMADVYAALSYWDHRRNQRQMQESPRSSRNEAEEPLLLKQKMAEKDVQDHPLPS